MFQGRLCEQKEHSLKIGCGDQKVMYPKYIEYMELQHHRPQIYVLFLLTP